MMAKKILWSGAVVLPSPVSISVNDEIIWTSDTGRTLSGKMVGDPLTVAVLLVPEMLRQPGAESHQHLLHLGKMISGVDRIEKLPLLF